MRKRVAVALLAAIILTVMLWAWGYGQESAQEDIDAAVFVSAKLEAIA